MTVDFDKIKGTTKFYECYIFKEWRENMISDYDLGEIIEDDEEYEIAADAFDEWMDSQEFDESDIEE